MASFWVNVTCTLPLKCEESCEEKYKFHYVSSVFVSIDRVPEIHCLTIQICGRKRSAISAICTAVLRKVTSSLVTQVRKGIQANGSHFKQLV